MSIEANIRRIAVDPANDYFHLSNKVTGGPIYLPRGRDIALQFGYYEKGIWVANPSHLTTITAEVKATRTSAAMVTATTATIANVVVGDWDSDISQHFTVTLPAAQTASFPVDAEAVAWLVVTALTSGGKPVTLVSGPCFTVNDGGNYSAVVPTPGDPTYVTAQQFYAAIAALGSGGGVSNGYRWQVVIDPNTQEWTMNITPA